MIPPTHEHKPELSDISDQEQLDYGSYTIPRKKIPPPPFPEFNDDFFNSPFLDDALKRNIASVLVGAAGDACLDYLQLASFNLVSVS